MPTTLALHFPDSADPSGPFIGSIVHRAQISAALGALFDITLLVHSTDAAIDPHAVVGARAELWLEGEPHLDRIPGVVRAMRQLTSMQSSTGATASYYEVLIAPALFLARHRGGRRLFQNKDVVAIVKETVSAYQSAVAAPIANLSRVHDPREYTTQYDETDLDFMFRVLSEEHVVSYLDPSRDNALVLLDDVSALAPSLPFRLTYKPPSNLEITGPAALSLRLEDGYATGAVGLRDYDFTHPQMSRSVPVTLAGSAQVSPADSPFPRETLLSHEGYEVDRFTTEGAGQAIAKRDLTALRDGARVVECETNVAIFPGTRFFVDDHPRSDAAGELLCVSSRITLDDGISVPLGAGTSAPVSRGVPRRLYSLRCVRVAQGYFPVRRRKPRAIGPETAFVVGAMSDGQIDVDEYGRVLAEVVWDRRDERTGAPSRRVRVSQGWAGSNRGFVTLPRIGDEILIGYDGGDPDQPMVIGRVHNAVARTPLNLPDPDKTVSLWKSRTVGGDGYNQVLMDDLAGKERLELHAEKTRTDLTLGDESSNVGGSFRENIGGKATIQVGKATEVDLDSSLDLTVGGDTHMQLKGNLTEHISGSAKLNADGGWIISGPTIELQAAGASIIIGNGTIKIKADASVTVEAANINIKASGTVDVDGALITLN
jgi:type VI secretion system secreted protein VgrG